MKSVKSNYAESIFKQLIKGKITSKQAATKLGVTKQYINRLMHRYKEEGIMCFEHKNKGKDRKWKTSNETSQLIVNLYKFKYEGFNFKHFLEKLNDEENILITYRTLYRILSESGIQSPKHKRKKNKKNIHTTRPRKRCFGELLQIDASLHNWFGNGFPKVTLHGAIDDATGIVMGLYFDFQETLNGYYEMLWKILTKYGIPETFYSDNRTIFEFRKLSEKNKEIDRDVHIQFKRCCSQLGIELITTSVPQAKGRIERLWQTLQSRLQSELILRNISTIEEANSYLDAFMTSYNNRFAISPDLGTSLFVDPPKLEEIDYYLSIQYQRKTDNGSTFKLNGHRYQIVNDYGEIVKIFPKETIDLYVTRSRQIVAIYKGKFYDLIVVEKTIEIINESPNKPKWKPGPNHPWRKYITNY